MITNASHHAHTTMPSPTACLSYSNRTRASPHLTHLGCEAGGSGGWRSGLWARRLLQQMRLSLACSWWRQASPSRPSRLVVTADTALVDTSIIPHPPLMSCNSPLRLVPPELLPSSPSAPCDLTQHASRKTNAAGCTFDGNCSRARFLCSCSCSPSPSPSVPARPRSTPALSLAIASALASPRPDGFVRGLDRSHRPKRQAACISCHHVRAHPPSLA
jgi:hypothetical protein